MENINKDSVFVGAGIVSLLHVLKYVESFEQKGKPIPKILVVERNSGVADETSFANGGHVTLGEGLCVARSDTSHYMTNDYTHPTNPGWLSPKVELSKYEKEWQGLFLENCKKNDAGANLKTLAKLGVESMEEWQKLMEHYPSLKQASAFQYSNDLSANEGLIRIYDESKSEADINWDKGLFAGANAPCKSVVASELSDNAALADIKNRHDLRFVVQQGGCIDARLFCKELENILKKKGVEFLFGEEVVDIKIGDNSGRITSIITQKQENNVSKNRQIIGDDFVFSTGADVKTREKLGFNIPVAGLAGITLTLPLPPVNSGDTIDLPAFPTQPIKLITKDGTIVISPLININGERSIRVGGTFGFADKGTSSTFSFEKGFGKHALDALVHHLKEDKSPLKQLMNWIDSNAPDTPDSERYHAWIGMRPIAPDLMPVIGTLEKNGREIPNAYFNGLHAFAGTSYAPVCATLSTQLMNGEKMHIDGIDDAALQNAVGTQRFRSSNSKAL